MKPTARTRAISLPFFSFQASELGKVLLILALAALIVDRARRLRERDTTARVMLAALVPAMLVIAQPDLGLGHGVHGDRVRACCWWRDALAAARCDCWRCVVLSLTVVLVAAPAVGVHVLKPYQTERLTAFLHPSSNFVEIEEKESKTGEPDPAISWPSRRSRSDRARRPAGAPTPPGCTGNYLPRTTPTSCSRPSASSTASSAPDSCCAVRAADLATLRILMMSKDLFGSLVAGRSGYADVSVFVNVGMTIGSCPLPASRCRS